MMPNLMGVIDQYCFADTIGPADVGLKEEQLKDDRGHGFSMPNILNRVDRWAQPITYVGLNESESFTVSPVLFPSIMA
jgi:plant cysteine oxidase